MCVRDGIRRVLTGEKAGMGGGMRTAEGTAGVPKTA